VAAYRKGGKLYDTPAAPGKKKKPLKKPPSSMKKKGEGKKEKKSSRAIIAEGKNRDIKRRA